MRIAIGVDSHKETLTASAVDELGRQLDAREFQNDVAGHKLAFEWIGSLGLERVVGIECSGSYGAAFSWFLMARGEDVREVPPALSWRERKRRPSAGKSDPVDAVAIAQVTAREQHLPIPKREGLLVDIRLLNTHREQLIRTRTQLANRCHRDLLILKPGYQTFVKSLRSKKNVRQAMGLVDGDPGVRAELTRTRLETILGLDEQIYQVAKKIESKLEQTGTSLTEIKGVGPFVAATILGTVGDISRIRSKAAFASFAGTAPLPASSGMRHRHRMNRGGNRQLNRALHVIAKTQSRTVPEAKEYITRKMQEGRSYKEALRCLQRQLSNVIYRTLIEDARRTAAAA